MFRSIPQTSEHYIHTFVSSTRTFQSSGQKPILQESLFACRFSKELGGLIIPLIRACTHNPRSLSMSGSLRVLLAELACFPNSRLYSFSLSASSFGSQIGVLSLIYWAFSLFLWKPSSPAAWRLPLLMWTQKARLFKACFVCLPSLRHLSGFDTLPTLLFFIQTLLNWPGSFFLSETVFKFFYQLG